MGSSHSKWTQSWPNSWENPYLISHTVPTHKTKASAYYSQETKEGYHLLIPQSLNFLSPPHLLLPKHQKIKTKPLKTKSASKPCHQDQLLRPPSPRPCSRPQPPTSPRRLLNPRSPITHSMLHSFSGSFCFLGFEFCVCVS